MKIYVETSPWTRAENSHLTLADLFGGALDTHRQWFMSDSPAQIAFWILNYFRLARCASPTPPPKPVKQWNFHKITLNFIPIDSPSCRTWNVICEISTPEIRFPLSRPTMNFSHFFWINNERWCWSLDDWVFGAKIINQFTRHILINADSTRLEIFKIHSYRVSKKKSENSSVAWRHEFPSVFIIIHYRQERKIEWLLIHSMQQLTSFNLRRLTTLLHDESDSAMLWK